MMDGHTLAVIGAVAAFLNICVTVLGGIIFVLRLEGKMNVQTVEITAVKKSSELISALVTTNALHEQRFGHIEERVTALAKGEGWITSHRESLNGEY